MSRHALLRCLLPRTGSARPVRRLGLGPLGTALIGTALTGAALMTGAAPASAAPTGGSSAAIPVRCGTTLHERPRLQYGSRGAAVVEVQRRLRVAPTSGWFGPLTRAAVMRFQAGNGISPSGVVGAPTWHALLCRARASRGPSAIPSGVRNLNWYALARCESGNDPHAVSPAGYYGLYQFDLRTWRSVGGSGYPHHASATEQLYRAHLLYLSRGAQPWPVCGRHLHT
jgi:hypothetical protein